MQIIKRDTISGMKMDNIKPKNEVKYSRRLGRRAILSRAPLIPPQFYKDFVLTMCCLKYISDVRQDITRRPHQAQCCERPRWVLPLMTSQSFQIPDERALLGSVRAAPSSGNGNTHPTKHFTRSKKATAPSEKRLPRHQF